MQTAKNQQFFASAGHTQSTQHFNQIPDALCRTAALNRQAATDARHATSHCGALILHKATELAMRHGMTNK
jgi:hypothetical protein